MQKFALLALVLFSTFSAHAGSVAITAINGGGLAGPASDQLYGWFFTANNDINVSALAVFDQNDDGLTGPHDVGIYRVSDQTLMGFATVPAGTAGTLLNGFRYISISTILLAAGNYAIVMTIPEDSPDGQYIQATSVTTNPAITWTGAAFDGSSVLTYPTQDGTAFNVGMFGPNFQFDLVAPEPGSSLLLVGGGLVIGLLRRRRAR